jgi:putative ABC transport system permease protein
MKKFWKRLHRRRQLDRDLEDELRFHLEMKAEETGDAREARRRLGNVTLLKEACREMWAFAAIESWWMDIRYAFRTLAKNRSVTLVAVVALGLGIGVNTAVFTIVRGALSFDAGIENADRAVLASATDTLGRNVLSRSDPALRSFRSQLKAAVSLAAYRYNVVNVSDKSGLPERYSCAEMSANGFAVIGRRPLIGRSFEVEDESPSATPVMMLTHHVWQDRYGKDPTIIGRVIRVDEVPRVVVGVMPPGMRFPEDIDIWVPLAASRADNGDPTLFGRLADGVKLAGARSAMDTIARRLANKYSETFKGMDFNVSPVLILYGAYAMRPFLVVVLCAVGFVLLIACANVANLLLARAAARSREISVRIAIGAGRTRIIRQLLVESTILSFAGGLFGWLVALAGLRWFESSMARSPKPSWLDLSMNTKVFVYLAAISIATGILFGLAPALQLAKVDVSNAIKNGGHGAAGGTRGRRLSSLLVTVEVTLCVVLLVGAGLMIRSAIKLYGTPIGVNAANVLTLRIDLPEAKYPRPDDEISFHKRLKARIESLPGVEASALASNLPSWGWMDFTSEVEGAPLDDRGQPPNVHALVVSGNYFRAMQVQPRRGHLFTDSDEASGSPAVIVNQSFATKYWPGRDPLGKHLRLINERAPQSWLTIIGVIPDIHQNFQHPLEHDPLIYLPYALQPQRGTFIVARTRIPPTTLVKAFRQEVQRLDENLPVYDVRSLEDRIAQRRLDIGIFVALFMIFAAIALLLASVGLYAVVAHSVSQRTREIGLRMAVGGTARDIVWLVFRQALRQVAIGLIIGLIAAFGVTRFLRAVLVDVSPSDPITFLAVVAVLLLTGTLGCAIPARRAVRVDPVVALRCD